MKKRSIVFILLVALCLGGCGSEEASPAASENPVPTATAEPVETLPPSLPFAEENALEFVEPKTYTLPVVIYSRQDGSVFDHPDNYVDVSIVSISSAPAEEEGYVDYSITVNWNEYSLIPMNAPGARVRIHSNFLIFDYYSGGFLPVVEDYESSGTIVIGNYTFEPATCTFIHNGEQYTLTGSYYYTENSTYVSGSNGFLKDNCVTTFVYSVKAPEDYDGLILGIQPGFVGTVPEDFSVRTDDQFSGKSLFDVNLEEWEFIRVSDYVGYSAE